MQRVGLLAAWLVATLVATAGAWQVVGAAESEVSEAPLTPVIAISSPSTEAPSPVSVSVYDTPTTMEDPVPTTRPAQAETDTSADDTTTTYTAPGETSTVSSTTSPSPSTTRVLSIEPTTTTTEPGQPSEPTVIESTTLSVPTRAGTVIAVGVDPDVSVAAVLVAPGWSYEVTDSGKARVRVRFHRGTDEVDVEIRWQDGKLVADTESN